LEGDYYQTYVDNMRFMNHSKTPNCMDTPDGKTIAIRDISIGEELTCDYSLICDMWK
jgi:SET domain-containing protein